MARKQQHRTRNPFVYEGYEGAEYFCDRTEETEKIISHLRNGRNVTLVSPRKIGKTGLIKHIFNRISESDKDAVCIYTDIFHTQNELDLAQTLGRAVIQQQLSGVRKNFEKILSYFSSWRPAISFDPLTGSPTVSINIERTHSQHTIESVFQYLKDCNKEVFFAIDEFQAVVNYPEKGTEALLRSHIQFMPNVHFIFSGSKQHLIYDMFGSAQRPFYQCTAMMSLAPLHEEIYYDFAAHFFKAKGGDFARPLFTQLYQQFDGCTWYIQSVLNQLYEFYSQVSRDEQLKEALQAILTDRTDQYETLLHFLTDNQRQLLKAIAAERIVSQPQSARFIQKYDLPSASSIKKAMTTLTEKDMVYQTPAGYIIYDRFFSLWLRHHWT